MGERGRNVFLLICDGMRADALASPVVQTPNWDRMAAEGVVLGRHRTTGPMCSPARASIFTGLQPHQAGMPGIALTFAEERDKAGPRPELRGAVFTEPLRAAGHQTFYAGKWHLGRNNIGRYFDRVGACDSAERDYTEWCRLHGVPDGFIFHDAERGRPYRSRHYPHMSLYRPGVLDIPEDKEHNWWVLGHALEMAALCEGDRPVMGVLSFEGPHPPLVVPQRYYDMYDPADVVKPDNWEANGREPSFLADAYYRKIRSEWSDDFEDWRKPIAVYWGYISYVDHLFGVFLDRLSEMGLLDDAVVAMVGDHGDMYGQHRLVQIFCPYEEVMRVPCVLRAPGVIDAGGRCEFDTSHVDLAPTILAAAGQEGMECEGENLIPYLQDGAAVGARDCFCEYTMSDFFAQWQGVQNWRALVRRPWKYVLHEDGQAELFDLDEDPGEMDNLAGLLEWQTVEQELRNRLLEWRERTGDGFVASVR